MNYKNIKNTISNQKDKGNRFLFFNISVVVIISILISACGATPTPGVTPSASAPTVEPTAEPTPEPTIDPAVLAEVALNEELHGLIQIFDDGEGLVSSYDTTQMSQEQIDALTDDQNKILYSEKMIDQAYAVLTYIRIGKMQDARRVLSAMQDMLNGDMADYVGRFGGGRSIGWWNIAVQQYYLLDPDPDLIELMQWVDYKGYWRQPDYYGDAFGRRITGEQPDFWENETNIETLVQTIYYRKLDEKYGLDTIYGVNTPDYNVDEQRRLIEERFNVLADNLKQVLYYGDDSGLHLIEGYTLVDTYTNAVIMACLLEKDYPEQFKMADVDFNVILAQIEANYAIFLDGKYHVYKAANEGDILPSFEASLQVANAYLAAAETFDYRKAHPEQIQAYADKGISYVRVDDAKAIEYRQMAETILADVWDITTSWNYPSIPLLEKRNYLYTKFGPYVFDLPAMSSLAQYVQFKKGSFFNPQLITEVPAIQVNESSSQDIQSISWDDFKFYKTYHNINDQEFILLRQDLESNGMEYLIAVMQVEGKIEYQVYLRSGDPHFK
jgi:hypothetical protein